MNPHEIEDTGDWLGCPTPLETCQHQLRMYENEFEELTLQLRQERERIFKLVEMHAEVSEQRDLLRAEFIKSQYQLAESNRKASDIETKSNCELMAKDKHISELTAQIRILKGDIPFADPPPHCRDNSDT